MALFTWALKTFPSSGSSSNDVHDWIWDSGHSQLVGVGTAGLVYTTPDLITITKQTASEANNWRGLAYAPSLGSAGRLVAVASNGTHRVMYSDDGGATWTNATAAGALNWQSVIWALGKFIAVASTGAADGSTSTMTSADGITWASVAAINPRQAWTGLAFDGTTVVAVSATSGNVGTGLGVVMTTTNGTSWTQQNALAGVNAAAGGGVASGTNFVQWDAASGLFAFVAIDGATPHREVVTAPAGGTTWTVRTLNSNTDACGGLIGFPTVGLVLFRQNSGNKNVDTSLNGSTWATENTGVTGFFNAAGKIASLNKVVAWADGGSTVTVVGSLIVPTVTSVSPPSGSTLGGTPVTITGTNFSGSPAVTFGGVAATSVVVVNATTITCVTGAHAAGLVTVAVGSATLANGYTYIVPPVLTSLTPIVGPKEGGTVVTLTGTGFTGTTSVTFGGIAAVGLVITSDTSMTCVTSAHVGAIVDVAVVGLVATSTLVQAFTFLGVIHVSPKSGTVAGGTPVTLTGFGFNAATGVTFGGVAATAIVIVSNIKMTAVTPAHNSGLVDVVVLGVGTGTKLYTYTLPVPQLQGKGPLLPPIPMPRQP